MRIAMLLLFTMSAVGFGQADIATPEVVAQVKAACADAEAKLAEVQKQHPEIEMRVSCEIYETVSGAKSPEVHYPLTIKEINALEYAGAVSTVAFHKEEALKQRILAAHHLKQPDPGEPCWHFLGFVYHTNYITETFSDPRWAKRHGCPVPKQIAAPPVAERPSHD